MATRAEASIRIGADFSELDREFRRASGLIDQHARRMDGSFGLVTRAVGALGGLFAAGTLVAGFRDTIGALDDLADRAQGLGIAASELSAFEISARAAGVGTEEFSAATSRLNRRLVEAAGGSKEAVAIFDALGVRIRDANGNVRDTGDVLKDVADRFALYADGANKSALAQELFGRGGAKLIAFLNEGRDGLTKFGGASEQQIENARRMQDSIDRLAASWERLKFAIAGTVAGALVGAELPISTEIEALQIKLRKLEENLQNPRFRKNPEIFAGIQREILKTRGELEGLRSQIEEASKGVTGGERAAAPLAAVDDAAKKAASSMRETTRALTEYQDSLNRETRSLSDWLGLREIEAAKEGYRQLQEQQRRLADLTGRAAAERVASDVKLIDDAFFEGKISAEEFDQAMKRIFGESGRGEIEKTNSLVQQLGLTFESAFENAIVRGEGLRGVLQAIGRDILRIFVRKNITEPAGEFLSGLFAGIFGGARADGGPVFGGRAYLVGERGPELFVPRGSGTIVPGAAASISIVQNFSFGSDVPSGARARELAAAIERRTMLGVYEAQRRGGALAVA